MARKEGLLRQFRKTVTFGALRVGMALAQASEDASAVEALRRIVTAAARIVLPLRLRLAANMKAVGAYRPGLVDEHFARAIDQMIMLAHVFRTGVFATSGVPERFKFDGSFSILQQCYDAGKGVINISPHICGYPVYAPVVTPRIPCSIYLRRNKDPRKMRITESVGLAGQRHLVSPDAGASKMERLQVAIDVLRQGRMLFITPDTPRKPEDGIPVTIFGRTVHFPTGVFIMSLRTGAPVVPIVWDWRDGAYHIRYGQPIELRRGGGLREQAEAATRHWAGQVDAFLREHPAMWWNWLDKRWTRLLRTGG